MARRLLAAHRDMHRSSVSEKSSSRHDGYRACSALGVAVLLTLACAESGRESHGAELSVSGSGGVAVAGAFGSAGAGVASAAMAEGGALTAGAGGSANGGNTAAGNTATNQINPPQAGPICPAGPYA